MQLLIILKSGRINHEINKRKKKTFCIEERSRVEEPGIETRIL